MYITVGRLVRHQRQGELASSHRYRKTSSFKGLFTMKLMQVALLMTMMVAVAICSGSNETTEESTKNMTDAMTTTPLTTTPAGAAYFHMEMATFAAVLSVAFLAN